MSFYDYNIITKNRIGFGWIDNSNRIKKTTALALSQNITEYWTVELGNYNATVMIDTSHENLLARAYEENLKFMVISTLGVSYSHKNNFLDEIGYFIDTHPDPDSITVIGHVLDKKDAFYELHPQTILINVDWWHSVGRPAPGEEQHAEQELPATVRSEENWHDDYTPHWVEHAGSSQVYKGVRRGWRWVKLALESGYRVHSFNETLRRSKIFLYPEVSKDTSKQYIHAFEAIQSYCHFIANTETPPSFNFNDVNFDWFDGAVSTAGGISPLITAHATKLRSHGKLIVADISPLALIIQQLMMKEDFDITNYKQEMLDLLDKNFISNETYGDLFLARANLDRQQEIINETPGLVEYYNTVYKQLNITYWQTNFFDIYSTNRIWTRFEGLCKVYVNLSNVFHYQNTSWLYSVEERYDFENKLLKLIATKGADKYYLKSNRQTGSWSGDLVDDLVAKPFKYPDILKELPWHTQL